MTSEANQDTLSIPHASPKLDRVTSPIACSLTGLKLRERRDRLSRALDGASVERVEHGLLARLSIEDSTLEDLAKLIDLERQCCGFFDFALRIESPGEHVLVEVSGPPEARALIDDFFASATTDSPKSGASHRPTSETVHRGLATKLVGGGASLVLGALGLIVCCGLPAAGLLSAAGLSVLFSRAEGLLLLSGIALTTSGLGLWLWKRRGCGC